MTTELNINDALDFSIQQIFAESYWEKYIERRNTFTPPLNQAQSEQLKALFKQALTKGNSSEDPYKIQGTEVIYKGGYAKLTDTLAEEAYNKYEVIDYCPNQPAGFSAILLKIKTGEHAGEYTLALRSTEYSEDFYRDAQGADQEIANNGFAYGQIAEMENYYKKLVFTGKIPYDSVESETKRVNISGYSLGGHLAYAFYTMRPDAVKHVYTQNAAGIGMIGNDTREQTYYKAMLNGANARFTSLIGIDEINMGSSTLPNTSQSVLLNKVFVNFLGETLVSQITSANYLDVVGSISSVAGIFYTSILAGSNLALGQALIDKLNDVSSSFNSYASDEKFISLLTNSFAKKFSNSAYLSGTQESNSIYDDPRYKLALSITKSEYNSKSKSIPTSLPGSITGGDGGFTSTALFPSSKFTTISGKATGSSEVFFNDPNFVSKSNLHSEYYDVFIEDHPELIGNGGRLPGLFYESTKKNLNQGDFGVTHSITALIDSLRAMKTLNILSPSLTVDLMESILNASSNQYATKLVGSNSEKATESNSITNVINSLYRLLKNPLTPDIKISRKPTSLGEVLFRDEVHKQEDELIAYKAQNPYISIESLYSKNSENLISPELLLNKAKQNNAEGMAYRYALREMNTFVVLGKDYSLNNTNGDLDLNKHSDLWYKARAEILVENISSNIKNNDTYYSSIYSYGRINDDISFRKTNYLQKPQTFARRTDLGQSVDINKQAAYRFNNVTIFDKDIAQTIPTSGPPISEYYSDTKYNDYIFMGNKNNSIYLKGGTDTIETGNNNNYISAYGAINSKLNLSLYGNNTIQLDADNKGGTLYYKNKLLTGGALQSNGTYQDSNYANVTYKFINNSSSPLMLQIKYLNSDNTYNITEIKGFNRTINPFGLNFNDMIQAQTTSALIDLTDNIGNPYENSSTITLTPTQDGMITLPDTNFHVSMIRGSYAYLYKEGGSSYKILVSNLPLVNGYTNFESNKYDLNQGQGHTFYYKPSDVIVIPKNMQMLNQSIGRSGDDLIFTVLPGEFSPGLLSGTIKNYFRFDHTAGTGVYYRDSNGNALAQVTQAELLSYNILSGGLGNDEINAGNHSSVYGGSLGNDVITSGIKNTTFISGQSYGSDTFISGSGNNRFVFSYMMGGQTIIKNIKSTDKIVFDSGSTLDGIGGLNIHNTNDASQYFFNIATYNIIIRASGNDLLIIKSETQTQIKIENYFTAFTNASVHSGIYLEDRYGVSFEINISDFETKRNTTLKLDQSIDNNLTVAAASQIKEIDTTNAKAIIKAEKDDVLIKTSGGTYANIELKEIPTTAHTGSPLNVIETAIGTPAVGETKDTNITVKNFSGGRDQLNVAVANISDVIFDKTGNDLLIRQLNLGETLSMVTLTDYFINNYNPASPTSSSGVSVYSTTNTTPLTVGALGALLANYAINRTANDAVITVGDLNRNTVITSTGSEATITGGKFNDDITAGNDGDVFVMSRGVDTYHLTSTSGIDELMFSKNKLFEGAAIIVQFDSSVALEDISFYYDKYARFFTIQVNDDNGLVISDIDESTAYSIEQFIQVKLSNGDNIFEENYTIENGGPFNYDGLPNNIILGTTVNNTLSAITSKNNLVFGGAGNDTITGNNNVIATGNTDYKANLLVGGLGNDTIAVGSYDLVMARQGDGQDEINYTTNHDDFLVGLIRSAGSTEFGIKTVGNNLEIYYGNGTTDKVTINSYWTKTHDEMNLVLTDRDSLNNTELRGYALSEIMSEMGLTKANSASNIHYVDYSDLEDILLIEDTQLLVGGELGNYYAELGSFTGLSLSSAVNTLNEFDQSVLLGKSGYGDISDYRKL